MTEELDIHVKNLKIGGKIERKFDHLLINISEKERRLHIKHTNPEMESKLKDWIIQERSLGVCISGFVIRVKALELERSFCEQMKKPCLFKASTGWMLNFLRRNRFVLRRITTTGRELPENAIETILSFIADMEKTFGGIEDIDFDSIINMDETSIYIDMPSN